MSTIAELAPTIILTICNSAINPITQFLTQKEQYDFEGSMISAQIARMWLGKTINLLIYMIVQTQYAFDIFIMIPNQ